MYWAPLNSFRSFNNRCDNHVLDFILDSRLSCSKCLQFKKTSLNFSFCCLGLERVASSNFWTFSVLCHAYFQTDQLFSKLVSSLYCLIKCHKKQSIYLTYILISNSFPKSYKFIRNITFLSCYPKQHLNKVSFPSNLDCLSSGLQYLFP